jgi:hypothetical protein
MEAWVLTPPDCTPDLDFRLIAFGVSTSADNKAAEQGHGKMKRLDFQF